MHWPGSTTLITGGSGGIGAAFARELGRRGSNLVLAARSGDALDLIAAEIRTAHGVDVTTIAVDLRQPGAAFRLYERVAAMGEVHAVINNAGFCHYGPVATADPVRVSGQVELNVLALTELTRAALPAMLERGSGAIVNIGSTAAYQPMPLAAVYAASKAYVLSFTTALAAEVRGSGVEVLAVCPGAVVTDFYRVAGGNAAMFGPPGTAERVVTAGLNALGRRSVVNVGLRYRLMAFGNRLVPTRLSTSVAHRMTKRA
jgi:uncharacterized protein